MHVAHVERPQRVEDRADCDHPEQQECHRAALVVEETFHEPHSFVCSSMWQ